jgi:putative transposase
LFVFEIILLTIADYSKRSIKRIDPTSLHYNVKFDTWNGNPPRKIVAFISRIFQYQYRGSRRIYMKKSRYSESQIISILKEAESGIPVAELCRKHGMSDATFYNWRSKYGGMDASMMKRMKELEEENRRLKKMYAEERLKTEIVQEALEKKW